MELLELRRVRFRRGDRVYRTSAMPAVVVMAIAVGFFVLLFVGLFQWKWDVFPVVLAIFVAVLVGVGGFCVKRTVSPGNWIMAITRDGLLVKFTGLLARPRPGPAAVRLLFADIKWVGRSRLEVNYRNSEGEATVTADFLDLKLKAETLRPLRLAILNQLDGGRLLATVPDVCLSEDGILRIDWSWVRPDVLMAAQLLTLLGLHRELPDHRVEDLHNLEINEVKRKLMELALAGHMGVARRVLSEFCSGPRDVRAFFAEFIERQKQNLPAS